MLVSKAGVEAMTRMCYGIILASLREIILYHLKHRFAETVDTAFDRYLQE
jgi:hypothetical protein